MLLTARRTLISSRRALVPISGCGQHYGPRDAAKIARIRSSTNVEAGPGSSSPRTGWVRGLLALAVRPGEMRAYEPVASDADAGRRENQDLIRPGSEGPLRRHQMAITGSQIAQPNDECDANGMIGAPRR
jgi:hypothetical protein